MGEPSPDWWRSWFGARYVAVYDAYLADRTPGEIDQLEELLRIHAPMRVLDLPCGQGRHSIELARRGYEVTGVDLTPSLLDLARERAQAAGVVVDWRLGDMREPIAGERFDMVLNLFTSFGYFADEGDDRKVAQAAASMLEPGGRFVVEVINGERVMANFEEREWYPVGDIVVLERRSLDRSTRRMVVERTVHVDGTSEVDTHVVRLYGPRELESILRQAAFDEVDLFGDWNGVAASERSLRVIAVGRRANEKGGS